MQNRSLTASGTPAERRVAAAAARARPVGDPGERVQLVGRGALAVGLEQLARVELAGADRAAAAAAVSSISSLRSGAAHVRRPGSERRTLPVDRLGRAAEHDLDAAGTAAARPARSALTTSTTCEVGGTPSRSSSRIFSMWSSTFESSARHPLDLVIGQLEPGEAGDVEDLIAIEHPAPILGTALRPGADGRDRGRRVARRDALPAAMPTGRRTRSRPRPPAPPSLPPFARRPDRSPRRYRSQAAHSAPSTATNGLIVTGIAGARRVAVNSSSAPAAISVNTTSQRKWLSAFQPSIGARAAVPRQQQHRGEQHHAARPDGPLAAAKPRQIEAHPRTISVHRGPYQAGGGPDDPGGPLGAAGREVPAGATELALRACSAKYTSAITSTSPIQKPRPRLLKLPDGR